MILIKKQPYVLGENTKDINIKEFFKVIWRRLWIVVLITIVTTTVGYFMGDKKEAPIYQTSTSMIIASDTSYMNTLMVMIKDSIVMEKVKEELNLDRSAETIASQIQITQMDESQVITITVTDYDPKLAMDIANITATTFKAEAGKILDFHDVQLLSEAKESNIPINQNNSNQTMIIALVFGLIVGIGLIFLLDSLDEKIDEEMEVEEILGVPVIGVISNLKKKKLTIK